MCMAFTKCYLPGVRPQYALLGNACNVALLPMLHMLHMGKAEVSYLEQVLHAVIGSDAGIFAASKSLTALMGVIADSLLFAHATTAGDDHLGSRECAAHLQCSAGRDGRDCLPDHYQRCAAFVGTYCPFVFDVFAWFSNRFWLHAQCPTKLLDSLSVLAPVLHS